MVDVGRRDHTIDYILKPSSQHCQDTTCTQIYIFNTNFEVLFLEIGTRGKRTSSLLRVEEEIRCSCTHCSWQNEGDDIYHHHHSGSQHRIRGCGAWLRFDIGDAATHQQQEDRQNRASECRKRMPAFVCVCYSLLRHERVFWQEGNTMDRLYFRIWCS